MIFLLLIGTLIAFICLSKSKMGTYKNPLIIYLLFWGIWLIISMLDPFRLYSVSDEAYLMLLANITFFSIGYVTFYKRNIHVHFYSKASLIKINKLLLIVIQCALLLALIYYFRKYNYLLATMNVENARAIKFEQGLLFSSFTEYAFFNYFVHGALYLTTIFTLCYYVINKNVDIIFFIAILNVVLFGLIGLGRFVVFDTLAFFLLANIFKYRLNKPQNISYLYSNSKDNKLFHIIIIFSAVLGLVMLTATRFGKQLSTVQDFFNMTAYTFEQAIINFIGPFRAFDHYLSSRIYENIGYTLGKASFSGIDEIICDFFLLAGIKWVSVNQVMSNYTVPPILIGHNQSFNAFYTSVMNSYLDGGLVGIVFLAFLYGAVASGFHNYYNKHPNIFSLGLLVYVTYTTIASEFRMAFSAPSSWMILLILTICSQRCSIRRPLKN